MRHCSVRNARLPLAMVEHLLAHPVEPTAAIPATREPELRPVAGRMYESYREWVGRVIRRGVESGEFRQVDPDQVADLAMALFDGLGVPSDSDPRPGDGPGERAPARRQAPRRRIGG